MGLRNILGKFRKKNKNEKTKLKYQLTLSQKEDQITIDGKLSKAGYYVKELSFFSRETQEYKTVAVIEPAQEFSFQLGLKKLYNILPHDQEEIFDLYLTLQVDKDEVSNKTVEMISEKAEEIETDAGTVLQYQIRFGRFQHTEVKDLSFFTHENQTCILYITKKGNLSFAWNSLPDSPTRLQIDRLKSENNLITIEGKIFTRNARIVDGQFVLKGRDTQLELSSPVQFELNEAGTRRKYGLNRYKYIAKLPLNSINHGDLLEEDVYDSYLNLKLHDHPEDKLVRIGRPTFRTKLLLKEANSFNNDQAAVVNPYFTFKQYNLSFEVYRFNKDTFDYLQRMLKYSWFLRPLNRGKNIWLVGERSYKAQDTGYHFFKYMREKHPEKNVFYVIEHDSPERKNIEHLGNVLDFKSKEHIWHALMATRVISSHHADYLYPLRTKRFKKAVKALKVFLQHGVMGTKNMIANYGKQAPSFNTDVFLVSSDFEKSMIVNDFGYDWDEVFVTGLSRFDTLLKNDIEVKRQLLIIPTWRDWIGSSADFTETDYFNRYKDLIFHPKLHELAKVHHFEIIFCLHPNMQRYTPYFKDAPVKVISQGEVDVQSLLKESAMMITDYSSVGFDFSFLHKPIIYYQFDRNRFIGKNPSHLDLDNDLPGEIVYEIDPLLDFVEEYAEQDFTMKEKYKERANKFLKYRDTNANERIYLTISENLPKKSIVSRFWEHPLTTAFFNRFRRSRFYFPLMKRLFKVFNVVVPIDKKLILFESSVGKQYADSPRNIYEEMLRQKLDFKYIWVCNKNIRFNDPNTKRITRLSPQYYFYLARAKYWVNNQNFPTYLTPRKGNTYLQTWHGTPLKKMLFDIENIQGRSDDYLDRVGHAVKGWDYLISPSEYATKAFRSAFRYDKEVLETGYPRNDIFYRENVEEIAATVRSKLNLPPDKKIILYAPTFRDSQTTKKNKFTFDINMDLEKLKEKIGDEYILLLRMHVVISNKISIPEELSEFVYNVSSYSDIQELYLISDILMTDYSSVMFDFANTGRPIFYYTYDLEDYRDNIRGFYMDFEAEAPGPFLFNTEDIINSVLHLDEVNNKYRERYNKFQQKFCGLEDGKASERVVNKIFK